MGLNQAKYIPRYLLTLLEPFTVCLIRVSTSFQKPATDAKYKIIPQKIGSKCHSMHK